MGRLHDTVLTKLLLPDLNNLIEEYAAEYNILHVAQHTATKRIVPRVFDVKTRTWIDAGVPLPLTRLQDVYVIGAGKNVFVAGYLRPHIYRAYLRDPNDPHRWRRVRGLEYTDGMDVNFVMVRPDVVLVLWSWYGRHNQGYEEVDRYDIKDDGVHWTRTPQQRTQLPHHSGSLAAACGRYVFALGGTTMERFDIKGNTWEWMTPPPQLVSGRFPAARAVSIDTKLYLCAWYTGHKHYQCKVYDILTDTWSSPLPTMPEQAHNGYVVAVDCKLWFFGSFLNHSKRCVWTLSPEQPEMGWLPAVDRTQRWDEQYQGLGLVPVLRV